MISVSDYPFQISQMDTEPDFRYPFTPLAISSISNTQSVIVFTRLFIMQTSLVNWQRKEIGTRIGWTITNGNLKKPTEDHTHR